jgi:hypothetical protein
MRRGVMAEMLGFKVGCRECWQVHAALHKAFLPEANKNGTALRLTIGTYHHTQIKIEVSAKAAKATQGAA